jgi:arylsulfatase
MSPDDGSFYFTHALSDSASAFIARHDFATNPLFLYLAYTSPHWPLHALQEDIDKYAERYKAGWDCLRRERFERQKEMGLISKNAVLSPRDEAVAAWDSLSEQEQNEFALRMAVYAAQIDAMDQGIGRVINSLEKKGQLNNTVIFFLSDNGACAEFVSGGKSKAVTGKADTHESYRINWANLSSTPFREYKHFTNEGGIATPLIVHYPNGISRKLNSAFVSDYGHLIDIMATCTDLGQAQYPETFGDNRVLPMQGISLTPNFSGKRLKRTSPVFWEHEANIAMRDGKWKIVAKTKEGTLFDKSSVKLYDMEADPTEMNDLSERYPERKANMFSAWNAWAEDAGVFPLDTRGYGQRQNAYRRMINGEFDDNFGGWNIICREDAKVNFSIDTENTISGNKTAKIEVVNKGQRPTSALIKWTLRLNPSEKIATVFKAKADRDTKLLFRIEKTDEVQHKILDREILLRQDTDTFRFDDIAVQKGGSYQIAFYLGNTEGTIWIDEVQLNIKDTNE